MARRPSLPSPDPAFASLRIPRVRLRLIALSIVAMSPLFLLTLHAGMEDRSRASEDARLQVRRLALLVADEFEKVVDGPRQLLSILSSVPVIKSGTVAERRTFLTRIVRENPEYANVGLLSTDGRLLACGAATAGDEDFSSRAYFRKALDSGTFAVGEYHLGPVTGKPGLGFALPLLEGDTPVAVLFATLDLSWLADLPSAADLPDGSELTLWDSRGTVLLRHPDTHLWTGRPGAASGIYEAIRNTPGEGTSETPGLDGIPRLYAFRRIVRFRPHEEVTLSIGVPADVAYAAARRLERRNLAVLALVTVLAALVAAAFGERLVLRLFTSVLHAASTDALTGVASRGRFLADAARELSRCVRFGRPLVALMVDIDRFKSVNDTWGHAAGDDVLVEVGKRLLESIREHDDVGRYGGEEFAVLLPESEEAEAVEIAQRIRVAIAGTPVPTRSGALQVTVSIGVASLSPGQDSLAGLLACADRALYAAKQAGRNRVEVAA
ncbi:MAG: GGDEF domain-containing protein [Planctomycetia bacterium]|nr:GGDEF domain-containing protein [Planctomycetia bacterium]